MMYDCDVSVCGHFGIGVADSDMVDLLRNKGSTHALHSVSLSVFGDALIWGNMASADAGGGSGLGESRHAEGHLQELSAFSETQNVKQETEEDKVKWAEQSDQLVHEYGRLVSVSACRHGLPESRKLNS